MNGYFHGQNLVRLKPDAMLTEYYDWHSELPLTKTYIKCSLEPITS